MDLGTATAALRGITLEALRVVRWSPSTKRTASKIAKRVAADRAAPAAALTGTHDATALVRSANSLAVGGAAAEGPARTVAQARAAASRAREVVAVLLEHVDAMHPRPSDAGLTGAVTPAGVCRHDGMLPAEMRVRPSLAQCVQRRTMRV